VVIQWPSNLVAAN